MVEIQSQYLDVRWVVAVAIFLTVLLPEAPNHSYSLGALQLPIGAIHLFEIAVVVFLLSFIISNYPKIGFSSVYLQPFIILLLVISFSATVGSTLHPIIEVIKDVRPLIPLSLVILFPAWFDNSDSWDLSYYLPILTMLAAVLSSTIALVYSITDPSFATYGDHVPGQVYYTTSFIGSNFLLAYSIVDVARSRSVRSGILIAVSVYTSLSILITSSGTKHVIFFSTTAVMSLIVVVWSSSDRFKNVITTFSLILVPVSVMVIILASLSQIVPWFKIMTNIINENHVRYTQSKYAFEIFLNNPLFGEFPGQQYSLQVETWRREVGTRMSRPTDGTYLSILADYGIIGFLPLVWLFSRYCKLLLYDFSNHRKKNRHHSNVIAAATATIPTFLIVQPILGAGLWFSRVQLIFLSFLFITAEMVSTIYKGEDN